MPRKLVDGGYTTSSDKLEVRSVVIEIPWIASTTSVCQRSVHFPAGISTVRGTKISQTLIRFGYRENTTCGNNVLGYSWSWDWLSRQSGTVIVPWNDCTSEESMYDSVLSLTFPSRTRFPIRIASKCENMLTWPAAPTNPFNSHYQRGVRNDKNLTKNTCEWTLNWNRGARATVWRFFAPENVQEQGVALSFVLLFARKPLKMHQPQTASLRALRMSPKIPPLFLLRAVLRLWSDGVKLNIHGSSKLESLPSKTRKDEF